MKSEICPNEIVGLEILPPCHHRWAITVLTLLYRSPFVMRKSRAKKNDVCDIYGKEAGTRRKPRKAA
jgi:hypothetical protein